MNATPPNRLPLWRRCSYLRGRIKSVNPLSKKRASGGTDVPLDSDTGETAMTGFVSGVVVASKNNPDWSVGDFIGGAMDFATIQVLPPSRLAQTIVCRSPSASAGGCVSAVPPLGRGGCVSVEVVRVPWALE